MILISVDLPAPLSPSRPSTSPLRRWRLTSRNAVTGPKFLAMCSTRSTSSGGDRGRARTESSAGRGGGRRRPLHGPPHALHVDVRRHRQDDREAEVEQQVVGVHALQREAVLEDAQEQRPDQGADDRSRAAREQRAPDHRGGDREEQDYVCGRGVRRDRARADGLENADEAAVSAHSTKLRIVSRRT